MTSAHCPYCGTDLDGGTCDRCGRPQQMTGWRSDPTARHEGRYYIADRPTNRVRDGRSESSDPVGTRMLPNYIEVAAGRPSIRATWLGTGIASAILITMAVAVAVWLLLRDKPEPAPPPEAGYLSVLHDSGLAAPFNSDANAVAHGRQVCRLLEDGEPQQGLPVDKVAVDAFCPHFAEGFHVLETAQISGSFTLVDTPGAGLIATDDTACTGAGGYSDVRPQTPVIVRNGKGEILATTSLGQGAGNTAACTFSFNFPATEGQDRYVVSVSDRGDFIYDFEQLRATGVHAHLGQ